MLRRIICLIPWIVALILTIGCDDRATEIAREAADRQARQNETMANLQGRVAGGTQELVAADAAARRQLIGVHHDLQAERTRLDGGWKALETERQRIAGQRRTESLVGPLATCLGGLLLVTALLGFCWYAVGAAHASEDYEVVLNEYLVQEVLAEKLPPLALDRDPPPLLRSSQGRAD